MDPEVHQVDTDDGTDERIDQEVCQVDAGDGTDDRIDPGVHQVDRQTINLPRRQAISGTGFTQVDLSDQNIYLLLVKKIIPPMPRNPISQDFFQL